MANILPCWEFVHNIIDGSVGRIIVSWNTSFCSLKAVEVVDQHILYEVEILGGGTFLLSAVYDANLCVPRRCLWQSLVEVRTRGIPWLLAGDFNIIKDITLTSGNTYPPSIMMEEFNGCLESIDVVELTSHGCLYTWGPKSMAGESSVRKLDYVSCNEDWLKVFTQSYAHFLSLDISDHAQIIIHLKQDIAWGVVDMKGSVLYRFMRRLKQVKQAFSKLNKVYSEISARVQECSDKFRVVQTDIFQAELDFMKNRARITWLEQGDFGRRFFSRSVLAYRNRQQISMIMGIDGVICTDPKEITKVIVGFYKGLFTSCGALLEDQRQMIWGFISKQIPRGACDMLSVEFYKFHWEEIQEEVFEGFKHIFATGEVSTFINATTVSLILKVDHPCSIKDYRPISCCNIFYKAVTMLLMGRMHKLMEDLISPSQSAFILGRNLGNSVLMLQELVQGYHKEDGVPRAAIKIDL
ncbi:hypothetical protein LIER_31638 [Lithospermum erythrorhizon]|uniref:Reverse transcriptase n=1 Tax=Lithospermum erythrorhizon TaxID=34254 RepID=A0AAV3RUP6_LITER